MYKKVCIKLHINVYKSLNEIICTYKKVYMKEDIKRRFESIYENIYE